MITTAWQKFKDNLTAVVGSIGGTLATIDVIGIAEPLKQYAREAFGPKAVPLVAAVLFIALTIRGIYVGRKHAELKAACDPANKPPDIP